MKKFICILITGMSIVTLCSCSHTIGPGAIGHNYAKYNIGKRLATEEYRVIRNVSGVSKATYFLGIGGLDNLKLSANSYANMVRRANLKDNQAIINVIAEMRVAFFPFICVRVVHTTGTIIEFSNPTNNINTPKLVSTSTPEYICQYRVGDFYSKEDINGVVVSVSEDGKHGNIISLCHAYKTWSNALEWCSALGKGWRLPTASELNNILFNIGIINGTMAIKSLALDPEVPYWTSLEFSAKEACIVTSNGSKSEKKNASCCTIAILEF
ncbi:MAG: hypothetical protein IKY24_01195 [Alistipes sp.]|nr:hypothetical protein [Alistipes sp.]